MLSSRGFCAQGRIHVADWFVELAIRHCGQDCSLRLAVVGAGAEGTFCQTAMRPRWRLSARAPNSTVRQTAPGKLIRMGERWRKV